MNHQCRNGHTISGPQDRRTNGHCAACARRAEHAYRTACREARHKLAAIEAALAL